MHYTQTECELKNTSHALFSCCSRLFGTIPEVISNTFSYSMASGGAFERDYKKDLEMSYNPRPARVAIIANSDAGIADERVLAALICATSDNPTLCPVSSVDISFSYQLWSSSHNAFLVESNSSDNHLLSIALSCLLLDRLRHIHLAEEEHRVAKVGGLITSSKHVLKNVPADLLVYKRLKRVIERLSL